LKQPASSSSIGVIGAICGRFIQSFAVFPPFVVEILRLFAVLRHPEKAGAEKTPKKQRISKGYLPASPVQSSKLSTSATSARLCELAASALEDQNQTRSCKER
jgi:hypothetical protein